MIKFSHMHGLASVLVVSAITCLHTSPLCAKTTASNSNSSVSQVVNAFANPPRDAYPRVWWHWMNGNITKDGIKKDLLWMKSAGIAGFTNFDAGLETPQIVKERLVYMDPKWKDAFNYALDLADSLKFEVTIASSPGWSVTGGPWVSKDDAMKKLVWRDITVSGGKLFNDKLPDGYTVCGTYQDLPRDAANPHKHDYYHDIAVVAVKLPDNDKSMLELNPRITTSDGSSATALTDGNLNTSCPIGCDSNGFSWILVEFPQKQTIRCMQLAITGQERGQFARVLESSDDGITFRPVLSSLPVTNASSRTIDFPDASAKFFRLRNAVKGQGLNYTEMQLLPVARVNIDTEKAGFAVSSTIADFYPTPETGDAISLDNVVDLTSKVNNGVLTWQVPDGRWRIFRFGYNLTGQTNGPASPEATGLEVDKFDKVAVKKYYNEYFKMYQNASRNRLGKVISHLMIDSYEAGCQTWTPQMPDKFKKRNGYSLTSWLPVLAGQLVGSAKQSEQFLFDWRTTLSDLICENHYDVMREILAGYGMKRYNESQEHYRMYVADGMDVKRNAEIPMSAFWIRDNGFYQLSPLPEADIRESASVAHIYGQNVCAAESFTTYGLGTVDGVRAYINTPGNLKHAADAAMAYGLNRFVIHCSVHQPCDDKIPGLGLGPYGQWFNRHETWAHEAKAWIDYLGRSTYMLQQGKFVADIAYFYGEDKNITSRFGDERVKVPEGYSFDFVNASILQNMLKIKNNNLTTASGMSYKVLVLDEQIRFMSLPVLKRIAKMAKSGVIIIGDKPQACANLNADQKQFDKLVNEVWNSGKANVYPFSAMAEALGKAGVAPDVKYLSQNTGEVHFVHRQLADGHIYWFANISPEARKVKVSCRVSGKKPYVLHPETGIKEEIAYEMLDGRTIITLDLTADDAQFVIFDENTTTAKHELPATELVERMSISSPWTVNFQENRGASAQAVFQRLKSLSESNVGSVRYFSGTARYSCTFQWNSAAPKDALYLNLGEVYNMARVKLNGTDLGLVWKRPFVVPVGNAIRDGENELEIEVTDTWQNRLIGDAQPNVNDPITYTAVKFYNAADTLYPAGLVGPVKIIEKMQMPK